MRHIFRSGDKIRVLVDEPYETELRAGEVVTVIATGTTIEPDGSELPVVAVSTNAGTRLLGVDVVEPVTDAYSPAEPDADVDAQLRSMLDGDEELRTILSVADTALGAEEERVGALLTDEDDEDNGEGYTYTVVDGNHFSATDSDGDLLDVFYGEQRCEAHGREGGFVFEVNGGEAVVIPSAYVGPLISFLLDRARFSQRPDDGTVAE